jgi:hypothetical protein
MHEAIFLLLGAGISVPLTVLALSWAYGSF